MSVLKKLLNWKLHVSIWIIAAIGYFGYQAYKDYQHRKWVASLEHSASPNVTILPDTIAVDYIGTDEVGHKRSLAVYLPSDYSSNDSVRYPVIYFMDGDSQFDQKVAEGTEWKVDEVIDSISALGGPSAIVVGVYNHPEDRLTEYKPFDSKEVNDKKPVTGPQHAEWLATDVKAWVDANYRTLSDPDNTTIGGCSLGGLMSWYMITHYPDIYGNALVYSPSLWVGDEVYTWQDKLESWDNHKVHLVAGVVEWPVLDWSEKLYGLLGEKGMTDVNLRIDSIAGEGHWHMCWQKGFKESYPWIVE